LLLLRREDVLEDDDEEARLAAFLCASHRSAKLARPGSGGGEVALLRVDPRPAQLLTLSAEVERGLVEAEVADLVLCASHLSSESARLGLASVFGRMAATHGVGSSGSIFHLGGVGSSAGRAACATLRCTRATGMAMVDRRRTQTHTIEKRLK
jgi:hypothetical protein